MAFLPADGRGSRPEELQIGILSHIVNPRKQGGGPRPSDGSHPHAFNLVRNLSVPWAFYGIRKELRCPEPRFPASFRQPGGIFS